MIKSVIGLILSLSLTLSVSAQNQNRMFLGVYDPSGAFNDSFMDVQLDFFDWTETERIGQFLAESFQKRRLPIVSLEPFTTAGTNVLLDTSSGRNDQILANINEVLNNAPQNSIWVRWAQEMELTNLYPWSLGMPQWYVPAYQHLVIYLREHTTKNLKFVFSPAGNESGLYYYPGAEFVDLISLTVLSDTYWDTAILGNNSSPPFKAFMQDKYLRFATFGHPIFIGEFGVSRQTEEERQAWLTGALAELHSNNWPLLIGIVYFNAQNAENIWTNTRPLWTIDPTSFWTLAEMPIIDFSWREA